MIREARKISLILYFSKFMIREAMENIANSLFFEIYDILRPSHPKSRIRAIWDTFASLKPPQIFNSKHLGGNLRQKCTPNQEYELFGIHLPPQKHPKSSIQSIWDTETSKNISIPAFQSNLIYGDFIKYLKSP